MVAEHCGILLLLFAGQVCGINFLVLADCSPMNGTIFSLMYIHVV